VLERGVVEGKGREGERREKQGKGMERGKSRRREGNRIERKLMISRQTHAAKPPTTQKTEVPSPLTTAIIKNVSPFHPPSTSSKFFHDLPRDEDGRRANSHS
jgi:hypothetical protein